MSPQLRTSVPVTLPLDHSDFTPEFRHVQVTLGASTQDTLFDGPGQGWGGVHFVDEKQILPLDYVSHLGEDHACDLGFFVSIL